MSSTRIMDEGQVAADSVRKIGLALILRAECPLHTDFGFGPGVISIQV
jgi:hypothetical protein